MESLLAAFSAENPHALRNLLLIVVTVLYLLAMVILFCLFWRANQKLIERKRQLKQSQQSQLQQLPPSPPLQEDDITNKSDTVHPHRSETHTDPKVS